MLPQLSGIPLQTTDASSDSSRNLNTLLPVGRNVSATVVAVSRDQTQPEIFRLKLEVNNRLIQMGVFQALPVGQKINVNRQSDGQIQITLPTPQNSSGKQAPAATATTAAATNNPSAAALQAKGPSDPILKLNLQTTDNSAKLPIDIKTLAAVISSRPIYTSNNPSPPTNTSAPLTRSADTVPAQTTGPLTTVAEPSTNRTTTAAGTSLNSLAAAMQTTAATHTPLPLPSSTAKVATTASTPELTIQGKTPLATDSSLKNTLSMPNAQSANTDTAAKGLAPAPLVSDSKNIASPTNNAASRPIGPPSHHMLTLALPDGSKVELASPRPLVQGTQLQLLKTASNEVHVLQIRTPESTPASALEKPAIQATLRNALPSQLPTADAFSQLSQVASQAQGPQASQISSVVKTMLQLFGVRPGSPEAPAQIKQNIELGGLSTEHNLSKGLAPHPQDMKHQLQQLQKLADTLPAEQKVRLEQLLQGVHSRVTSQQLTSLQQWREMPDGGFERVFQLDLPVKNGEHWDNLELRLSREGGTNAAGEMISVWRVRLHFDLEDQGGVDAEIRLTDGHEISTLFWCELKETADKLRERSDEFSARLRQCGFDSTEVNWHEGTAPEQKQTIHKQLVDLHT